MRVVLLLVLLLAATANAQDSTRTPLRYALFYSAGVSFGQSAVSKQFSLVNGIKFKTWYAGAGVGVDYYFERTVPVFLQIRKELKEKMNTPFALANGGYHFEWIQDEAFFESEHRSGWYYEAGAGYRFGLGRKSSFNLSAVYSYKPFSKLVDVMPWSSVWPPPPGAFQRYDYQLRRLQLNVAVGF